MTPIIFLAVAGTVTFALLMLLVKPLRQSQEYHRFADCRTLMRGVPNTMDVVSNAPFLVIGAIGILILMRPVAIASPLERIDTFAFFIGTILTGVGSTLYHYRPDDDTLVYDRLGMTIAFMSFLSMIVHERVDGLPWLLPVLLAAGALSVAWWRWRDDLRPYGWVQFFPIFALIVLLLTTPPRYSGETATLTTVIALYAMAKAFELFDRRVLHALHICSGHTLKHLVAACAPLAIAIWIASRSL